MCMYVHSLSEILSLPLSLSRSLASYLSLTISCSLSDSLSRSWSSSLALELKLETCVAVCGMLSMTVWFAVDPELLNPFYKRNSSLRGNFKNENLECFSTACDFSCLAVMS